MDAQENLSSAPEGVQSAFRTMRLIVLVGWAIYPLGYVVGYVGAEMGSDGILVMNSAQAANLNAIYNIATLYTSSLTGQASASINILNITQIQKLYININKP